MAGKKKNAPPPKKQSDARIGCTVLVLVGAVFFAWTLSPQGQQWIEEGRQTRTAEAATKVAVANNTATARASITPTITPTPTNTLTPTLTFTPSETPIRSATPVPSNDATRMSEAYRAGDVLGVELAKLEGVINISLAFATDDLVSVEAMVRDGFRVRSTAERMQNIAAIAMPDIREFSVILADSTGATDFVWRRRFNRWTETALNLYTPPAPDTVPVSTTGEFRVEVIANSLNVRSGPGTNYTVIGRLPRGNKVVVTGISADQAWYFFRYWDADGWISADGSLARVESGDTGQLAVVAAPEIVPTSIPVVQSAPTQRLVSEPPPASDGGTCPSFDFTCSQLTCQQAQACLAAGNTDLDADGDGTACDRQCGG